MRFFISTTAVVVAALCAGCASSIQGSVGPLGSPKAAQIVDLVDDMFERAKRLASKPELQKLQEKCQETRKLELPSGRLADDPISESSLWKSSAIPSGAVAETRCMNQAQSALEDALSKQQSKGQEERNSLQDRLLTASEQSCGLYKRYLNANQSSTNFSLGSASLVLAAVATNITDAVAAKNYTTGALIGSGLAAEYNVDMFNNQMVYAIGKAIDATRQDTLNKLRRERAGKSLTEYGLSAAIGDALRYHELCSLMGGLAHMDKSVLVMSDPGLKHMASWFPSGTLSIKNGVVTAEKLQAGESGVGSAAWSMSLGGTETPSAMADMVFVDVLKSLEDARLRAKGDIFAAKPNPETNNSIREEALKQFEDDPSKSAACANTKVIAGNIFTSEKPPLVCKAEYLLAQLCDAKDCDAKEPKISKGKDRARDLATAWRDAQVNWRLQTQADPDSAAAKQAASDLATAFSAHQSYLRNWLEPAYATYLKALQKYRDEKLAEIAPKTASK